LADAASAECQALSSGDQRAAMAAMAAGAAAGVHPSYMMTNAAGGNGLGGMNMADVPQMWQVLNWHD